MKIMIFLISILFVGITCFYFGYRQGKNEYDAIGERAVIISSGSIYVKRYNDLMEVKELLNSQEFEEADLLVKSRMNLIEGILEDCFDTDACERNFGNKYPQDWLSEINSKK